MLALNINVPLPTQMGVCLITTFDFLDDKCFMSLANK